MIIDQMVPLDKLPPGEFFPDSTEVYLESYGSHKDYLLHPEQYGHNTSDARDSTSEKNEYTLAVVVAIIVLAVFVLVFLAYPEEVLMVIFLIIFFHFLFALLSCLFSCGKDKRK